MKIVNILTYLASAILFSAAILKLLQGPTDGLSPTAHLSLISAESVLAVALASGVWRKGCLLAGAVCFATFSIISFARLVKGHPSCGCFGKASIPPGITMVLDLFLAAGLAYAFRLHNSAHGKARRRTILATAATAFMMIVIWWPSFQALRDDAPLNWLGTVNGRLVVLEPGKWVGKKIAFDDIILGSSSLSEGEWVVILYHDGCSLCDEALTRYQSFGPWGEREVPKIALIAMPPSDSPSKQIWANFNGSLPENHDWFAETPVVFSMRNRKVIATFSGAEAIDPEVVVDRKTKALKVIDPDLSENN